MKIKEQVFGAKGYSADLCMSNSDLDEFRSHITEHWLQTIASVSPDLVPNAKEIGIQNYHLLADKLDHKSLWPKANRVLPQVAVDAIKNMDFFNALKQEFGSFLISDVYDTRQHYGREEIYWRLVRPGVASDVGPLHVDKWFHQSFNMGHGMFPAGTVTVKIWIPIYCEPGKNGLAIVEGSHLEEYKFDVKMIDGLPKPIPYDDLSMVDAKLISTEAGNILIFHENTLHGGGVNQGGSTRVSAEITMVLPQSC